MAELLEMLRVTLFGSPNTSARPGDGPSFDATRDIPSLAGKNILITGAAGGLGRQAAVELARHGRPARIYIADLPRDEAAKQAAIDDIAREAFGESSGLEEGGAIAPRTDVRFLELDLTCFESVRKCATEFVSKENRLDILIRRSTP